MNLRSHLPLACRDNCGKLFESQGHNHQEHIHDLHNKLCNNGCETPHFESRLVEDKCTLSILLVSCAWFLLSQKT